MNILITTTAFTALFCGAAFAQSSDIAHEAHRFVNNASAVSHVNSSTHENLPDRVNKNNTPSFSEMNEHERAIVAHSFMNNSASYAHQKMIEEHKKMLSGSDANSKTSSSSFNELNAGEKPLSCMSRSIMPVRKHIRRRQESFAGCIRPGNCRRVSA